MTSPCEKCSSIVIRHAGRAGSNRMPDNRFGGTARIIARAVTSPASVPATTPVSDHCTLRTGHPSRTPVAELLGEPGGDLAQAAASTENCTTSLVMNAPTIVAATATASSWLLCERSQASNVMPSSSAARG